MTLREVIGGITEPITLSDVKEHIRVTGTDEDEYLLKITTAARQYVENEIGQSVHLSTYDLFLDYFNGDIEVPKFPLSSVTYVKYYNASNVLTTLVEDTDYRVDTNSIPGNIEVIDSWPFTYDRKAAVQIRFISGYAADQLSPLIIHAIKLKISLLYEDREGGNDKIEEGFNNLMNKLKVPSF